MKYLLSILCLFVLSCDSGGGDEISSISVYNMSNQKFFSSNDCTGDYTMEWYCFNESGIYDSHYESNNDCEQSCSNECFVEEEGYLVVNDNKSRLGHLASGLPGSVDGMLKLHEKFSTKN